MNGFVRDIRTWSEMIKLSHSVFALPFAVMAAFLAARHLNPPHPPVGHLALILVCMVAARSVAMTFNRIVDAQIDARNPRTAGRPLPAGRLTRKAATLFLLFWTLVFALACFAFRLAYGNPWPMLLGGPVLLYLCGYSYMKRFTRWSHFYLGSAIALSPPAAWLAVHPDSVGLPALLLAAAVTTWIGGFDIIYACQDIDVDRRDGLHSLPSRLGPARALTIARISHAATVALLAILGVEAQLGWLYFVGVAGVALLLVIENSLVRANDFSRVNLAFFTINGVVSVLMGMLTVSDVLLGLRPPW